MQEISFQTPFGTIVGDLRVTANKKVCAICLHGYCTNRKYSAQSKAQAAYDAGLASFNIDFDNLGESEPDFSTITITREKEIVKLAIKEMQKHGFTKFILVGGSFGGLVSMAVALEGDVKALVLYATASNYWQQSLEKHGKEKIEQYLKQGYYEREYQRTGEVFKVNAQVFTDAQNYNMWERAKAITCPTLIIHGELDQSVPLAHTKKLTQAMPHAQVHIIKGANHGIALNGDKSKALRIVKEFLEEFA